jgi:hypothetical protein
MPGELSCARKSSHHSRGGVGARNFERATTSHPTQTIIFTSHQVEPSAKKPFARAIGYAIYIGIFFEKIIKNRRRASCPGSPRAGSGSARVQGHLPVSLQRSCDIRKHGNREVFRSYRRMNKACNIYSLMYKIKQLLKGKRP